MIQPLDLLDFAEVLAQGPSEVEWRTAVNRAYYAVFLEAREFLTELGFKVPRAAQAHGYLWLRLSHSTDPAVDLAGSDLADLQGERNRADYDHRLNFLQTDATQAVSTARTIVQSLAAARVDPLRSQVRNAIRDYERNVLKVVTYQGP